MIDLAQTPVLFALGNAAAMAVLVLGLFARAFFNGKPFFLVTLVAVIWWLCAAALELSAETRDAKLVWAQATWPGIALVPAAWAMFLTDFCFETRHDRDRRYWAAVFAAPVVVTLLAATNGWHWAFYGQGTRLVGDSGLAYNDYEHGPLFYLAAAFLYVALIYTVGVLAYASLRAQVLYRPFFRTLFFVTLIPLAGNFGYVVFGLTIFGFDPTPFLFVFTFLLLGGILLVSRVLDLDTIGCEVLFRNALDAVIVYGVDGTLSGCNDAARDLLGPALGRAGQPLPRGGPIWDYAARHIDDDEAPAPHLVRMEGRAIDMRLIPIHRPLHRRVRVMGWVLTLRDATDLLQLSDALTEERDHLVNVMESSGIGFFIIAADGRILYANHEAEKITGRSQKDILSWGIDRPVWHLVDLDGKKLRPEEYPAAQALRSGSAVNNVRVALVLPDGSRRIISINALPFTDSEGTKVVCSVTDVTEEERATEALRAQIERAEAANRAKSQFLALMSHEIRTPLNGVLGMAELLSDGQLAPEQARKVDVIRNSGRMLLDMLNDVLDAARLDGGEMRLETLAFRPADIAAQIDAAFAQQAEEKGLEWEVFASAEADIERLGDPARVAQILRNLASNAIKFTETGVVTVTVSARKGRPVVLTVTDTGQGVEEARLAQLMEPFWQADRSTTRRHSGSGLGLTIVAGLSRIMGGDVRFKSTPGEGTLAEVTLPLPEA
ncbi:histidine kinase N-terminal 7TM domain-containing protein [Roseivivax isoporae]|uniref:histidine kinase n=1 Tax=Roseivivax isoporae LMG 25204 TaxID=1449351 RepID=X7F806_9RHOB|nr:histidine kinase N-terminal 7TM domain-containing protein [Roseivivax isoporae]ETX28868.1 hypothetical protein RISW2_03935 [Roseivivax isoporae LMG 25204]